MKLKPTAFFQMAIAVLMAAVLFHSAGFRYPRAKALPMVVAAIVLGLVIIDLWRTIRQSQADRVSHDTGGDEGSPKRTNRQYLIEGLWLAGFCIGVYVLGFLISMPLFVFSYLASHGSRRSGAITIAVVTTVLLYGTFVYLLGVKLYPGIILDALGW